METLTGESSEYRLPTFGKLWHVIIFGGDLIGLNQALVPSPKKAGPGGAKISDELNSYILEESIPELARIGDLVGEITAEMPSGDRLCLLLKEVVEMVGQHHRGLCLSIPVDDIEQRMRFRYAVISAPIIYSILVFLHLGLRHIYGTSESWLNKTPHELLRLFLEGVQDGQKYPLSRNCFRHEAKNLLGEEPNFTDLETRWVDRTALSRWYNGRVAPSLDKLISFYGKVQKSSDLPQSDKDACAPKIMAQCYARLLDWLFTEVHSTLAQEHVAQFWNTIGPMLARYEEIKPPTTLERTGKFNLSDQDYYRAMRSLIGQRMKRISELNHAGAKQEQRCERDSIDQAAVAYGREFRPHSISRAVVSIWVPLLDQANLSHHLVAKKIDRIRGEKTRFCAEHPFEAVALGWGWNWLEARLALADERLSADERIRKACECYLKAFEGARYRAGDFTKSITFEALGYLSWLWRRDQAKHIYQIKRILKWWDLLELGDELANLQLDRRIELAASAFESGLCQELVDSITREVPELKRSHIRVRSASISTFDEREERMSKVIRPNRKEIYKSHESVMGLDTSPLMEAIAQATHSKDAGAAEQATKTAKRLIKRGADLSFPNASGNSALTYAFTAKAYDLILEMLRREKNPVTHQTLLQPTKLLRLNVPTLALLHSRKDILEELTHAGPGNVRDRISMDEALPNGRTPLVFCVEVIAWSLMDTEQAKTEVVRALAFDRNPPLTEMEFWQCCQYQGLFAASTEDAMSCLRFLIEEKVDIDAAIHNGTTALMLAAHYGLSDVAFELLRAGADANHRSEQNVVPLYYAIRDDNVELARMLIEWGAKETVRVPSPTQGNKPRLIPIGQLPMSEAMRTLISYSK